MTLSQSGGSHTPAMRIGGSPSRLTGMTITNHAIEQEWKDLGGPHPNWMHQLPFLPCECQKYFFCSKGLTNGIAQKMPKKTKMVFINHHKSHTITKGCTMVWVNLDWVSQHYRQCYRNLMKGADEQKRLISKEKRRLCNSSTLGCSSCDETICKTYWEVGYDVHLKK